MSNLTEMFKHWTTLINDPTPRKVSIPSILVVFPGSFKHSKMMRRRGVAGRRLRGWSTPRLRRKYHAVACNTPAGFYNGCSPISNKVDLEFTMERGNL